MISFLFVAGYQIGFICAIYNAHRGQTGNSTQQIILFLVLQLMQRIIILKPNESRRYKRDVKLIGYNWLFSIYLWRENFFNENAANYMDILFPTFWSTNFCVLVPIWNFCLLFYDIGCLKVTKDALKLYEMYANRKYIGM